MRLERSDGLARVTLDRPPLNILDIPMLDELRQLFRSLDGHPRPTAVLITGAGKAFCAGVSVEDHTADRVDAMIHSFHRVIEQVLALPCPVIAALNGAALGGGCELALACDTVLARDSAKIGQPEIKLGVFPPAAAVLLPRLVGRQRAMDLILSGRVVSGPEAVRMGLATRTIPDDEFEAVVEDYATSVASLSPAVLRLAKRAVHVGETGKADTAMQRVEELYLNDLMELRDAHEGLSAFREKRTPVWQEVRA